MSDTAGEGSSGAFPVGGGVEAALPTSQLSHYAAAAAAAAAAASSSSLPVAFPSQVGGIHFNAHAQPQMEQLLNFWQSQLEEIRGLGPEDWKLHQLPLARIKKIMRSDDDVKMISAEAPVLFSKACEMFILELTLRAWLQSESSRRRTLQRSDIAAAITGTDVFDFLVDIVPREGTAGEDLDPIRFSAPHAFGGGVHPNAAAAAFPQPTYGVPQSPAVAHLPKPALPTTHGFNVSLDPHTLYQWQWAQQQANQPTTSGSFALPANNISHQQKP